MSDTVRLAQNKYTRKEHGEWDLEQGLSCVAGKRKLTSAGELMQSVVGGTTK
jgi:hypothetical protein